MNITFESLGLSASVVKTLSLLGYETPTPIQAEAIPVCLQGGDLIAQAQTGTGKTAAFALPIIQSIDISIAKPQALVLAPTRELAIQVAEALKSYAKHLPSFHVLPIYGGQEYFGQLTSLKRGVHVVVGTPGRVMDHMRRGTLKLDALRTFVLDEADEMLNMGFIEDIEWILQELPEERQIALFSATMPPAIQKVASNYLRNPTKIQIASQTKTVSLVDQCAVFVTQYNKLEAITRFLETETFNATIIFARTKTATVELAEKLSARGYSVDALNGDVKQNMREKIIQRLKNKTLDVVVATEVAARGLDVERLDLVVNYDIPTDSESYVHRVGRTGRAGRSGKAITFVTPRERGLLSNIERSINTQLSLIPIPSLKQMHEKRVGNFSKKIIETLARENLDIHRELIERIAEEGEYTILDLAAGLAFMLQGEELSKPEGHDELSRPVYNRDRDFSGAGERTRNRGSNSRGRSRDEERRNRGRSDERRPSRSSAKPVEKKTFSEKPTERKREKRVDKKEDLGPRKKRVFSKKSKD
jgi:ATP-dependent RNA helicase DeaD